MAKMTKCVVCGEAAFRNDSGTLVACLKGHMEHRDVKKMGVFNDEGGDNFDLKELTIRFEYRRPSGGVLKTSEVLSVLSDMQRLAAELTENPETGESLLTAFLLLCVVKSVLLELMKDYIAFATAEKEKGAEADVDRN